MSNEHADGFSGKRTAEIVGITYRQLDYWARTDLIRPSLVDAKGSGSRRRYSYRDLLELKVVKSLLDAGIKLESVRAAFGFLREQLGEDVVSANLVINGASVVLATDETLIDVIRQGQGVLNLLSLDAVKAELDTVIDLRPTAGGTEAGEGPAAEAASGESPTGEAAARAVGVTAVR